MNSNELALKKHSSVIQMSNRVTSMNRKMFNSLIFIARKALKRDDLTYKFSVNIGTIKELSGIQSTDNTKLKRSLNDLVTTKVEYNILGKDKEHVWGSFNLLAGVEIRKGIVEYSFSHQLYSVILNPSIYAILDLNIIKGLQSKYSIALYEIGKDYINASIPRMTMETFRELMGLKDNQYKNSKDLRRNVMDPAANEITEKTDLKISYELYRHGRKVVAIKFNIRRQNNQ